MDLKLLVKNVYGQERIHPACPRSEIFAKILGTKSIPEYQLPYLEELGYGVKLEGWTGGMVHVPNPTESQPHTDA